MAFLLNTSLSQVRSSYEILTPLPRPAARLKSNRLSYGAFFADLAVAKVTNDINKLNRMLIKLVDNLMFFNYFYYNSR